MWNFAETSWVRIPALAVLLAGAAVTSIAPAQASFPVTVLVREGDAVPGVGLITRIDGLAVNNSGDWSVHADSDADASTDAIILRNGVLFLREGAMLPTPAGASISSFDSLNINIGPDTGWNVFLRGLTTSTDSGVFFNDKLVIQESNISTAPEFTPGTPYIGWFDVKMNDSNTLAMVASVDDTAIPTTVDRALVIAHLDADGTLLSESVLAKEGEVLPGQTETVADFGTSVHESAFNNQGKMLYFADLNGPTTTDGVIYLDRSLVAQEGHASVVPGRNYETLSSRAVDLNNFGDPAFKANLDGDASNDEMIVVRSSKLIREGDSLPAIGAFRFTSFGTTTGPLAIDDDRNVLWYGDWDNPDTTKDTGLFINDVLIFQKGTAIGANVVTSITNGDLGFALSRNGRYVLFEAVLDGTLDAVVQVRVLAPRPVPDGNTVPGTEHTAQKNLSGDIDIAWDVTACPNPDYNLFYGDLSGVSTYTYTGAFCQLGNTGQYTFSPPPGSLFWIIAGADASGIEGGHGFDSQGRPRPASAGGQCGVTSQIRSALCP